MLFLAPLCRNSSFYIFFLSFHISYNALHRPTMVRREFICLSSQLKIINITIFDCPWPINLPLEHIKTTANLSFFGLVDLCQFLGTISTFLLFLCASSSRVGRNQSCIWMIKKNWKVWSFSTVPPSTAAPITFHYVLQ